MFLQHILGFIFPGKQGKKIIVLEDDEGAIYLAKDPPASAQSKHIDVVYHLIWNELIEDALATPHIRFKNQ